MQFHIGLTQKKIPGLRWKLNAAGKVYSKSYKGEVVLPFCLIECMKEKLPVVVHR